MALLLGQAHEFLDLLGQVEAGAGRRGGVRITNRSARQRVAIGPIDLRCVIAEASCGPSVR
jgi:hypothetical protein